MDGQPKRPSIVEVKGYKLVRSIKKGPNVHTYMCTKQGDNTTPYLLKEFRFQNSISPKHLQQIKSELAILATVSHPNIITIVEHFHTHTEFYLVTEYAEGGSLATWMTSKKESGSEFVEVDILIVMVQICMALSFVHSKGLIHGNLKPSNVLMFCQKKMLKLSDVMLPGLFQGSSATPALSAINEMVYPPPELAKETMMTEKSDIWFMGLLLCEMSTLQRPFQGRTFREVFSAIQRGAFTPLPSAFSDDMKNAIANMLHPTPTIRNPLSTILSLPCARVGMRAICTTYDSERISEKRLQRNGPKLVPVKGGREDPNSKIFQPTKMKIGARPTQAFAISAEEERRLLTKKQHLTAIPRQHEAEGSDALQMQKRSVSPNRPIPRAPNSSRVSSNRHECGTTFPMRSEKSPRAKGIPTPTNDLRWSADNLPVPDPKDSPIGRRNSSSAHEFHPLPGVNVEVKRRYSHDLPAMPQPYHSHRTTSPNPHSSHPHRLDNSPREEEYDSLITSMRSYLNSPDSESEPRIVTHSNNSLLPPAPHSALHRRNSRSPASDSHKKLERHVEFKRENDVFNYSVRNCSMKEFKMNGVPVVLPNVSPNDPLNVRLESLRVYLESHLGVEVLRIVHKIISEAGLDESDDFIMKKAIAIVGEDRRGFVELVSQLVFCEAIFDSQ